LSYLESEKQKTAVEAARKKEAAQTAENIEIARKKAEDLTNQLHEVEKQERVQSQEQDIAKRLINESASRLSTASRQVTCRQQKLHKLCWTAETIS